MSGGSGSSRRSVTPSCAKLDKIILKKINNVFKFFNIKVEKEAVAHIKLKYDLMIKDLYMCIKKIKGDITASKVALIIKKSKIMKKKN
jgi:galactitol-specific phosphotransferase system IIB component